jgi:hypothetical protein
MLLEYAASLLESIEAFAAPKLGTFVMPITARDKRMNVKELRNGAVGRDNSQWKSTAKRKCKTMHILCIEVPRPPKHQAHGWFWRPWAWEVSSCSD